MIWAVKDLESRSCVSNLCIKAGTLQNQANVYKNIQKRMPDIGPIGTIGSKEVVLRGGPSFEMEYKVLKKLTRFGAFLVYLCLWLMTRQTSQL
jgi:hypothetical protein